MTTDVVLDPTDSTRLYAAVVGVGVVMRNVVTGGWGRCCQSQMQVRRPAPTALTR